MQPTCPVVCKVLAVALCLAPARCGAADCCCDRKDVRKDLKRKTQNVRDVSPQLNAKRSKTEPFFWEVFWRLNARFAEVKSEFL